MIKPTDEKFISIEYDTWINKYKPMEEQLKTQSERIKQLEKQNKISVIVSWRQFYYEYQTDIGTIDINIESSHPQVTVKHKDAIKNTVDAALKGYGSSGPVNRRFITTDDLKEYEKQFERAKKLEEKLIKEDQDLQMEITRLKYERKAFEKDKAAIRLPKFLSKFFKLK